MNRRLILLVIVLLVMATVFFSTEAHRPESQQKGLPDEAKGRVALLQLMAEHCPACRDMEPVLEQIRTGYAERVHVLQSDVFQKEGTGWAYGISVIPAHLFYDHQGQERYRHEGVMTLEQIAAILDGLLLDQGGGGG